MADGSEPDRPATLGRFELGRQLGVGGMGVVVEARDPRLHRMVALKRMRPDVTRSAVARARFLREAQVLARLHHPNVVTVFEVGEADDEIFIAMEVVAGDTLRDWMRTPHDWREVVDVFQAIGRGLAAAHALGLVHRDVKPANILIDRDGTPKIADFGVARAFHGDDDAAGPISATSSLAHTLTSTGGVMGTPAYMAPEQGRGGQVDGRADQYAFCVSLHEALTGARPGDAAAVDEARCFLVEGRPGDALARLASAQPLAAGGDPEVVAAIRFYLARAHVDRGDDRARNLTEARAARKVLGPAETDELRDMDRWLAAHR